MSLSRRERVPIGRVRVAFWKFFLDSSAEGLLLGPTCLNKAELPVPGEGCAAEPPLPPPFPPPTPRSGGKI